VAAKEIQAWIKKAYIELKEVMKQNPKLFYYWEAGYGYY
jgi:hypothetical protein